MLGYIVLAFLAWVLGCIGVWWAFLRNAPSNAIDDDSTYGAQEGDYRSFRK